MRKLGQQPFVLLRNTKRLWANKRGVLQYSQEIEKREQQLNEMRKLQKRDVQGQTLYYVTEEDFKDQIRNQQIDEESYDKIVKKKVMTLLDAKEGNELYEDCYEVIDVLGSSISTAEFINAIRIEKEQLKILDNELFIKAINKTIQSSLYETDFQCIMNPNVYFVMKVKGESEQRKENQESQVKPEEVIESMKKQYQNQEMRYINEEDFEKWEGNEKALTEIVNKKIMKLLDLKNEDITYRYHSYDVIVSSIDCGQMVNAIKTEKEDYIILNKILFIKIINTMIQNLVFNTID